MGTKNYRKIYSDNMNGLKWDSKLCEIHHLDLNHNNNNFSNLVLLPKTLYNKFHTSYDGVSRYVKTNIDVLSPIPDPLPILSLSNSYLIDFWNIKLDVSWFLSLKQDILAKRIPAFQFISEVSFEEYVKFFSTSMYWKYFKS